MAKATCNDCSHEWNLTKPVEEYSAGPRCAECGSFDIAVSGFEGEPEPVEARAFREFREGATPAGLVESGICDPEEAARLRVQFNELTEGEHILLTADELAERERQARAEAEEEAAERWRGRVEAAKQRAERQARRSAYERGQEDEAAWWRPHLEAAEEEAEEAREQVEELEAALDETEAELAALREWRAELKAETSHQVARALEARGAALAEAAEAAEGGGEAPDEGDELEDEADGGGRRVRRLGGSPLG